MYDVLGCCAVAYQGCYLRWTSWTNWIVSFGDTFNFHIAKCYYNLLYFVIGGKKRIGSFSIN